jgi:hypothetical protein
MPLHDVRVSLNSAPDMSEEIVLLTRRTSRDLPDLSIGDMEVDDQRQRAMPDILEFPAQDPPWLHGQVRGLGFQGLYARHFIRAHHSFSSFSSFLSRLIQVIDVCDFLLRLRIGFGVQPVAHHVRLERPPFSSRAAWRAEIVSTMPRAINSSAISRPVHWLIGRPAFSGASHTTCSIWHT